MQRLEAFQLQVMAVFAQAFQHGRGERGSELQPVDHPDVGRSLLHRPATTQQPGCHPLGIVIGHDETLGIAEGALQARVLHQIEVLGRGAVEAVEAGAQALPVLPKLRRVETGVVLVNLPTLFLLVEQCQGDARDLETLGEALQLFAQHLG
ncbi:hypothetical protein D3C86_973880 [compost metagenome]